MNGKSCEGVLPNHVTDTAHFITQLPDINETLKQNMQNLLQAKLSFIMRSRVVKTLTVNSWPGEIKKGQEKR